MKFKNGAWLSQDGMTATHPAELFRHESSTDGKSLTLYAPARSVIHRGYSLSNPVLTYRVSSPANDVIKLSITHFEGDRGNEPTFELFPDNAADVQAAVHEGENDITFSSGDLSVIFSKDKASFFPMQGWSYRFEGAGEKLTDVRPRGTAHVQADTGETYMYEQLSLGVGASVYGLGERFGAYVKNGQKIDIWNLDSGTSTEDAYKNVPFYYTNKGYGVFVANTGRVSFEIGTERVDAVQFSAEGEKLEYYVIYGPTPKEILDKYTKLTGRPPRLPAWSYGLWLSTSFTTDYDDKSVAEFVDGMAERNIPLSAFHYDCFWMKPFHWTDFEWDADFFPDPVASLKRQHEKGLRVCVWLNPYIAQQSKLFAEGKENGYLIKKTDGSLYQTNDWQAGMALVDFTNPAATAWYQEKLREVLAMGVDSFKTDFGERIPVEDIEYFDGSNPERMHNYYTFLYNKAVFEVLEQERGEGEAVLFARSATSGGQRFPLHWGGDCESTYEAMAETLRGGLSLAGSGFSYWAHDIGGFEGKADPELFKRWVAFGLFSSHSRLHGSTSVRVPWEYDDESSDVTRKFTTLKLSLLPTIARYAEQSVANGTPIMRAMNMEFPGDRSVQYLDRQYMFGDDLLVAPIFQAGGDVEYFLPEGTWTSLINDKTYEGGRWIQENHDVFSMPILVRPGAILATQPDRVDTEGSLLDGINVRVYEPAADFDRTIVLVDGFGPSRKEVTLSATVKDSVLSVELSENIGSWSLSVGEQTVTASGLAATVALS